MENVENKPEDVKETEVKVEETKVEEKVEEGFFSKLVKNRRGYQDNRK